MTPEERQLDRDLNRLERMLERCIEADKAARRERRAKLRAGIFKLEDLLDRPKKREPENRQEPGASDDEFTR